MKNKTIETTNIIIRISVEEKLEIQKLAKQHYLTMSSYIRMKSLTNNNK